MITSTTNGQVKYVQKLQKKKSYRESEQSFIIEGWRLFKDVPEALIKKVYVLEKDIEKVKKIHQKAVIEPVAEVALKAMSQAVTPQGVLAVIQIPMQKESTDQGLVIALDRIQDPGNLGTILRTAEAAGVDQVILSKGTVDLYNPKVVQATMGAIFRLPIRKNVDLASFLKVLRETGYQVYAAYLEADDMYYGENYKGKSCFLMGNEGEGLTEELLEETIRIQIPMKRGTESLNVAMATGILVYEALRQRNL